MSLGASVASQKQQKNFLGFSVDMLLEVICWAMPSKRTLSSLKVWMARKKLTLLVRVLELPTTTVKSQLSLEPQQEAISFSLTTQSSVVMVMALSPNLTVMLMLVVIIWKALRPTETWKSSILRMLNLKHWEEFLSMSTQMGKFQGQVSHCFSVVYRMEKISSWPSSPSTSTMQSSFCSVLNSFSSSQILSCRVSQRMLLGSDSLQTLYYTSPSISVSLTMDISLSTSGVNLNLETVLLLDKVQVREMPFSRSMGAMSSGASSLSVEFSCLTMDTPMLQSVNTSPWTPMQQLPAVISYPSNWMMLNRLKRKSLSSVSASGVGQVTVCEAQRVALPCSWVMKNYRYLMLVVSVSSKAQKLSSPLATVPFSISPSLRTLVMLFLLILMEAEVGLSSPLEGVDRTMWKLQTNLGLNSPLFLSVHFSLTLYRNQKVTELPCWSVFSQLIYQNYLATAGSSSFCWDLTMQSIRSSSLQFLILNSTVFSSTSKLTLQCTMPSWGRSMGMFSSWKIRLARPLAGILTTSSMLGSRSAKGFLLMEASMQKLLLQQLFTSTQTIPVQPFSFLACSEISYTKELVDSPNSGSSTLPSEKDSSKPTVTVGLPEQAMNFSCRLPLMLFPSSSQSLRLSLQTRAV